MTNLPRGRFGIVLLRAGLTLAAFAASNALAIPALVLSQQNTETLIIHDNDPLDSDATVGRISFTGQVADYAGSFAANLSPFVDGGNVPVGQPFMTFTGSYSRMTQTSNYAFIVWLVGTDFGPVDPGRLTKYTFSCSQPGSSSWYLNPPSETNIGSNHLVTQPGGDYFTSVESSAPFSLMNTVYLGVPTSTVQFTSSAEFALSIPDHGSTFGLVLPWFVGVLLFHRRRQPSS